MTGSSIKNKKLSLSIIVPLFNEIEGLPALLAHLQLFKNKGVEVVLVDGGSADGTVDAVKQAGFTMIHSDKGRGTQMNAGVKYATGDVFLFLHADTLLPNNADKLIEQAAGSEELVWGRFNVQLDSNKVTFSVISFFINWRSSLTGIATGDQAIFINRVLWDSVGGFPQQMLMEDIEICKRLKNKAQPVCFKEKVITSARRWHKYGVWQTIFLMWRLRWLYWRGVSAEKLAEYYQ